jgi:hypothetical protein
MAKTTLDQDLITDIKTRAQTLETNGQPLQDLFARYREIYFMDNIEKPKNKAVDNNDWKLTVSPAGRNAVTGMKRLMDTGEVHVEVKVNGNTHAKSEQIERGLLKMLAVSGDYRRARVEKDANLSAVLYGPVIFVSDAVTDMMKVHKKSVYRTRMEKIQKRTPFLLDTINPENSYAEWGRYGMLSHLTKTKLRGSELIERWGVDVSDKTGEYTLFDWIDPENRVVWADGYAKEAGGIILATTHKMHDMNISARYAGGSGLFQEEERMLQSFLYAHAKGEWDKRENLFFTYLFTALYMQGLPGPLLIIDPDSVQGQTEIDVDYTGGVRKIIAKAQTANLPVVDRDTLEIKRILDEISADSTIYKQTLGQSIQGSTYSGLAMLSQSGQLPLEDPKEAVEQGLSDTFDFILCRIKYEGIENEVIQPADIPDEWDLEVKIQPKLPQDDLRNTQITQGLGELVSDEWKLGEILKIQDPKAMLRQVTKEIFRKAMVTGMTQDPKVMQVLIAAALPKILGQQTAAVSQNPAMQAGGGELNTPDQAMPGGEILSQEGAMPAQPPQGAMPPGMQQMEQTNPMVPPNERQ